MEWVKCIDYMPDDGAMVIVFDGTDSTHAKFDKRKRKFYQDDSWCTTTPNPFGEIDNEIGKVTHWMPLPEPPEDL